MMPVVLDASVAVKWYVNEVGTEKALRLLDTSGLRMLAADIFRIEVINALLRQLQTGQLTADIFSDALKDLALNKPELVPSTEILDRAVTLAQVLSHSIYDCLYLASAERRDAIMITADAEFVQRCRSKLGGDPIVERLRFFHEYEP